MGLAYTLSPLLLQSEAQEGRQSMGEESEGKPGAHLKNNGQKKIEVTPIELLAFMLRIVLKDRITEEEIETICSTYYQTIQDWWG